MKNYFEDLLWVDRENFSYKQSEKFDKKVDYFKCNYHFFDDQYNNMIEEMKEKKDCYVIIEGLNSCIDGYCVDKIIIVDNFENLEEFINEKSKYLCHIYHFNYDKAMFDFIYGDFDQKDRIYPKEVDGVFVEYDLYENRGKSFDTLEEFKNYFKKYKKNIKIYDTVEEIQEFYSK
ncbi:hypothetical protein [Clostridium sp. M14]|uniref:hypothetical protein n=1 Tax=Clostridium sp. M14 TaxID=2716311 RepID=UPI0013EEC689|nr:hypothetical protein [Clostridium sp. M14]MBZ9693362.1 hypothetical protein [Clostridium sp. M14]